MDAVYGINVKNKFDLFCDEDVDPLDIIAQAENAKKTEQDKKKKDDKGKKNKAAKKQVLTQENKNKQNEEIKPAKEGIFSRIFPKSFLFRRFDFTFYTVFSAMYARVFCQCQHVVDIEFDTCAAHFFD